MGKNYFFYTIEDNEDNIFYQGGGSEFYSLIIPVEENSVKIRCEKEYYELSETFLPALKEIAHIESPCIKNIEKLLFDLEHYFCYNKMKVFFRYH